MIKGESDRFSQHRILDVKLQNKPTPYYYFCEKNKEEYNARFLNEGRRHAMAYIAKSINTDNHLGWMQLSEGAFSVRERTPYKSYFPTKILNSNTRFTKIAEQWGKTLALNHLRAHKKFGTGEIINKAANSLDEFSQLVISVALEYADLNQKAYKKFLNKLFLDE